jgi:uncharacterized protein (TIGR03083 family)
MAIDLGEMYRSCRERITTLVSAPGVDPDLVVPATPEWSVHDVIAHLSGIAEDAAQGNMAGAPGESWTAAQVTRGRERSIAELIEKWNEYAPGMEAFFSSPGGEAMAAGVFDVHTHEADLRNALGLPVAVPADFLSWAAGNFRVSFTDALAETDLPAVEVAASDLDWFRGRLGRRTVDEVCAFGWSAEPAPYLDAFFIFGRASVSLGERE